MVVIGSTPITLTHASISCHVDMLWKFIGVPLSVPMSSVTPDSINVASGATLDYSGGNIATLTSERGATIDMMKLTKPITITDHYCTEGAVIKSAPGMVTVTNEHPYGNAPRFGV